MSLPLSRRIARVALLVAAGAAPVMGAAGAASAADLKAPEVSGLTAVDGATLGNNVASASHQAGVVGAQAGHKAVDTTLPSTTDTVGKTAQTTAPAAQKVAGDLGGSVAGVAGSTAQSVTKDGLPTKGLPSTGSLPNLGG
ncbi:ATP-binding protein [Streptomyces sp. UNOC14_S4]|uniref:ATP-binding protein n=1 Tax=Streptomyces sp. UNOC14_S4 TaxID=2872340 RepID=UPI001E52491D|nr:ATP-binding protein [Streptomyces sp. UNOC14_S4]MCC3769063.1 ATP-binding protein [Streptomyces sp. UNOC14_S4]